MSAKTIKHILKCSERSVKRKSNISFKVIKNSSFDQRFLMVKTFLKILWWRFLVPHSEHLLVSSATLSCMTKCFDSVNVSIGIVQTYSFFLRRFSLSLMHLLLVCSSSLSLVVCSSSLSSKCVVYISTVLALQLAIAWIGMECCSNFCVLITLMYFKDRNWISKTVNCISCSVVCKIVFCSDFPDILDNAGKVTRRRRRRRRTQAIAKRYTFHANAIVIYYF